jgi:excisionase family DNA binding protein
MNLLSITEAMKRLSIGRTKLYALLKTGELKARRIYGRTLIAQEDLDTFIQSLPAYNENENNA